jgi:hypothetical protein
LFTLTIMMESSNPSEFAVDIDLLLKLTGAHLWVLSV